MDANTLREHLRCAYRSRVTGCFATTTGDNPLEQHGASLMPLVACARHKAAAVHAELEILDANEARVLSQLESHRDSIIAVDPSISELMLRHLAATTAALHSASAIKRCGLEREAVSADEALEKAAMASDAITEVRQNASTQ